MTYRRPGVTGKEIAISNLVTISGGAQIPAVVAPGTNFILVEDEAVVRGAGADTPTGVGSDTVLSVSRVGSMPGISDYTLGTQWNVSGNTITWQSGQGPDAADTYYVTYKKTKPSSYYNVQTFYDIDDAREIWGYEMENGAINPITLAAKMLFDGGASQVLGVQQETINYSGFTAAIDKLKTEEIDILLIPGVTHGDTYLTYAITHVNAMSSELEGKERILIVGPTLSNLSVTQLKAAVPTDNQLVSFMAPCQVKTTIHDYTTGLDESKWVNSGFAAASLAGVMCDPGYDVAEPMLRKTIPSIDGITNYLRSEADAMAAAGIMVLEQSGSVVRPRHDLTTYVGDSAKEQISVVRIKHYVQKNWRILLDKYVGQKLTNETLEGIKGDSSAYLTKLLSNPRILNGFRALKVSQSATEARRVLVSVEINPIFPTVWIEVSYGIYVA